MSMIQMVNIMNDIDFVFDPSFSNAVAKVGFSLLEFNLTEGLGSEVCLVFYADLERELSIYMIVYPASSGKMNHPLRSCTYIPIYIYSDTMLNSHMARLG